MKRLNMLVIVILLAGAVAGCPAQREQKQQGQAGLPPMPLITPDQIRHLQDAATQNPKNANAWIALGNALMDTRQFGEAAQAYEKALALDPKNVDVRVDMGTCYKNTGRPEKAIEEYRKAIKITPNHLNAHRNSGVVLAFDLNRPGEAVKELEKYLELAPNAPDAGQIRQVIQDLKAKSGQR